MGSLKDLGNEGPINADPGTLDPLFKAHKLGVISRQTTFPNFAKQAKSKACKEEAKDP